MNSISFCCKHKFQSGFQLNLNFDTRAQVVALFGPSGSGKSSILSSISGIINPHQGKIRIGDQVLYDTSSRTNLPSELRHVGLVAQDHLLFPHMNVEANLKYGLRRKGKANASDVGGLFERVCKVLEVQDLLNRYPRRLSGGESQRVAIGRALMSQPEVLLLDEPISALDDKLRMQVLRCIEQVIDEWKIPTIYVSHRQGEVRRFADWVVVIENGRKITEGPVEDALTHSKPMAWKQGGTGPVNLLKVKHVRREGNRCIGTVEDQQLQLPSAGNTSDLAYVQFAPHDVVLSRNEIEGLSTRNRLSGKVRQLVSLPAGEFIAIDIGQIIWAEVTTQSVVELGLRPGESVTCYIKAQSLERVG